MLFSPKSSIESTIEMASLAPCQPNKWLVENNHDKPSDNSKAFWRDEIIAACDLWD